MLSLLIKVSTLGFSFTFEHVKAAQFPRRFALFSFSLLSKAWPGSCYKSWFNIDRGHIVCVYCVCVCVCVCVCLLCVSVVCVWTRCRLVKALFAFSCVMHSMTDTLGTLHRKERVRIHVCHVRRTRTWQPSSSTFLLHARERTETLLTLLPPDQLCLFVSLLNV